jgi:pullulanase
MKPFPVYPGPDLGITWGPHATRFRVWAPGADALEVRIFQHDIGGEPFRVLPMRRGDQGTWTARAAGNWRNVYCTYAVTRGGAVAETVDPYARAVGANGRRAMIFDPRQTNPAGWARDRRPAFAQPTDAVIYELHVRDFSIHPRSGMKHPGKFLAFTEQGTRGPRGVATGVDHLVELGVTHVHLLPAFDYESVDETRPDRPQYNWGYDPQHYNTPEGSYATDPHDGRVRIREFKAMVQALHRAGIRVVMDVVYNHTFRGAESTFHQLVPGYYHRQDAQGGFSNGSGCGNETASERPMFRKFMVESLVYWAREYHIDGFRFDLMGLHDLGTMRAIRAALDQVDPTILLYGEGWTGGDSPLPAAQRVMKTQVRKLRGVAAFSDVFRDALKGSVFQHHERGFVSGARGLEEAIKAGLVASTAHPQVAYPVGDDWRGPWAGEPGRCVSYDSCHDNHTLWDRLLLANPKADEVALIRMNKLCAALLLTAQGIAFLHAGEEFLRSKGGVENSYNRPDRVNRIDWGAKARHRAVFDYYRGLVALRRARPEFRLTSAGAIRRQLTFLKLPAGVVGFHLRPAAGGDVIAVFNATCKPVRIALPRGGPWGLLVDAQRAGPDAVAHFTCPSIVAGSLSALVVARDQARADGRLSS